MLRLAVLAFSILLLGLFVLTLLPEGTRVLPEATIELRNARVTLYPEADPAAIWRFNAPRARFDPNASTTELFGIDDGERTVDGVVDFTLRSERMVIDARDDLIAPRLDAYLIADAWDVMMEARDSRNVRVNQQTGRFEVPHVEITGDGIGRSVYQDMRITFDFTDFAAGGPGTVGTSAFVTERNPGDTP